MQRYQSMPFSINEARKTPGNEPETEVAVQVALSKKPVKTLVAVRGTEPDEGVQDEDRVPVPVKRSTPEKQLRSRSRY